MNAIRIVVLCLLLTALTSCKLSSEAMLVDHDGRIYYGGLSFDAEYQIGLITFPGTPYGDLTGPFIMITTDEKKPVIKLDNIPLQQFSGKAQLGNKEKRFLECDITAEFKSKEMGDMKMIGCGTCYDENKNTYDISFQ